MKPIERRIAAWARKQTQRLFRAAPDFDDPETIHQMRVASRRLRVALRFLGLPRSPALARLGRALGAVRALDVNLALLQEAPLRDAPLEQRLRRERERAAAVLRRVYRRTKPVAPRVKPPKPQKTLAELYKALRSRWAQFEKKQSGAAFHKLRIAVKKYRYALEIFGAQKQLKRLKKLQELMGACHDVEVLLEWLPKGPLRKHFEREHRRRYKAAQKFLDRQRHWVKKLEVSDE